MYDRLPRRRFQFVPLWGITVYFAYALRRVNCPDCGVTAERVPWARGKSRLTTSYRWFLALGQATVLARSGLGLPHHLAKCVRVGKTLGGLLGFPDIEDLDHIEAIGVDEIEWGGRGHHYLTVVYEIEEGMKRLLWVAEGRSPSRACAVFSSTSRQQGGGRSALSVATCAKPT